MEYEIMATLGPSSRKPEVWERMIGAGVTSFRLNTSHLTLEQVQLWLQEISAFYLRANVALPLVLDLQGSKWRLGRFAPFKLTDGKVVQLVLGSSNSDDWTLPVPHPDFFAAANNSSREIYLNDAKIQLEMESVEGGVMRARVKQGGMISPGKGITYLSSGHRKEYLNEKDGLILEQTSSFNFLRYALSYVRDAAEMALYRSQIGNARYLIAKLERKPAVEQAEQIAEYSNELWMCRGDLGAELGLVEMAAAVHEFSKKVRHMSLPVLMAGQVLEHMTREITPTRSEVCYLYDCLTKGYRGFVLSDETAVGRYPVESVRVAAMFALGSRFPSGGPQHP
jgi:pyruvate kinase